MSDLRETGDISEQAWLELPHEPEGIELLRTVLEIPDPLPLTADNCQTARAAIAGLKTLGHQLFAWDGRVWFPQHDDITSEILVKLIELRHSLLHVLETEPPDGLDVPALLDGRDAISKGELSERMLAHFGLQRGTDWDYEMAEGRLIPALTPAGLKRLRAVAAGKKVSFRTVDRRGGHRG